jgi:hypothetical protein
MRPYAPEWQHLAPPERVYDVSDARPLRTYRLYWVRACEASSRGHDRERFLSPHWNYFNDVRTDGPPEPAFIIEATSVEQACLQAYALVEAGITSFR